MSIYVAKGMVRVNLFGRFRRFGRNVYLNHHFGYVNAHQRSINVDNVA